MQFYGDKKKKKKKKTDLKLSALYQTVNKYKYYKYLHISTKIFNNSTCTDIKI